MFYDRERMTSYGHNHITYTCACGVIVHTCSCKSDDKEQVTFDHCGHGKTLKENLVIKVRPGKMKTKL